MLSSSSPAGGALVLPLGLAESAGEEGRCVLSARHVLLSPRQSGRCSWRFRRSSARLPWSHSRTVAIPASVVEMTKSSQPILIMNPRISQLVASNKESTTIHKVTRSKQRWCRPAVGKLKINSDGAYIAETGEGGWGFVIRDSEGEVILSSAGRISYLLDAFQAEVVACLAGARAANALGMGHVVFETDSIILKQAMDADDHRLAATGGLIYELKKLIGSSFLSCSFVFAPRECNRVAHDLAALGCKCPRNTVEQWDMMPPGMEDLVAAILLSP